MEHARPPTLLESIVTLTAMVVIIVTGIRLQSGIVSVFLPLTLSVGVVGSLSFYLRHPWDDFSVGILDGVGKVSIACVILLLIGALVGVWIESGTIPTLVYYGLQLISPSYFLPTTFLVCLIMSLATGTAYGTIGTVGIALIGVAVGLGLSAPMAAGAILSGAYFGDKMSPLSDTTNMASAVGETDLFRHVRSMTYTTVPAAVITFLLFAFVGKSASPQELVLLQGMLGGISSGWHVSWLHVIPIGVMLVMALKRIPTLLLIFVNVLLGAGWSMAFQKASLADVFRVATVGFSSKTGIESVDRVMSRGGMTSMQAIIILVVLAGALGGSLRATGVLDTLVTAMLRRVRRTGSLIASVLASCYVVNLFTGNQALAIILPGSMFLPAFRDRGIDASVLTRSLEDAGTLGAPLVPWGVAGGFCSQMLDVPTLQYLPYMWLAFTVPVFSLLLGYTGIAVWPAKDDSQP